MTQPLSQRLEAEASLVRTLSLLEKATPGEIRSFRHPMGILTPSHLFAGDTEIGQVYGMCDSPESNANAIALASAVNLLRSHGAVLLRALVTLEEP